MMALFIAAMLGGIWGLLMVFSDKRILQKILGAAIAIACFGFIYFMVYTMFKAFGSGINFG